MYFGLRRAVERDAAITLHYVALPPLTDGHSSSPYCIIQQYGALWQGVGQFVLFCGGFGGVCPVCHVKRPFQPFAWTTRSTVSVARRLVAVVVPQFRWPRLGK
jgi:hypothetical protein